MFISHQKRCLNLFWKDYCSVLFNLKSGVSDTKMATGVQENFEEGSDAVYDYSCTPCTDGKLNAKALFYCRNCSKLFCYTCIRHHNQILKDHRVLGRAEVARWGKVKIIQPAMMCEEHRDKEEEMYCADHYHTCCTVCVSIYHRACKKVTHVSVVAKGIQKTSEFQSFLTNAASTQTRLRNLLDKRIENIKLLQRSRNKITSSFNDIRKSFSQFIDTVETKSVAEMDRLLFLLQRKVQSDTKACSEFENEIRMFEDDIRCLGNRCEEFAFQCFSRCKEKLSSAEEFMASLYEEDYRLEFIRDASIQQFQSSLKTFGKFEITPINLNPDFFYTVDEIQQNKVRTSTDKEKCDVTGMCQLPDGRVVVVDNTNKKIKLLSSSQYTVVTELDLPRYPEDICTTYGTELVATVCLVSKKKLDRSELHFINVSAGQLTHTRFKQLDHDCSGIDCHSSQLYVGSDTALYQYSLSGQKLRKIYEDASSLGINIAWFAVSDDGNRIHFTKPYEECLVTVDNSGKKLSVLKDCDLQKPTGICAGENGAVFVCGMDSDTVILVNSQGTKKIVTLARRADGVLSPRPL